MEKTMIKSHSTKLGQDHFQQGVTAIYHLSPCTDGISARDHYCVIVAIPGAEILGAFSIAPFKDLKVGTKPNEAFHI